MHAVDQLTSNVQTASTPADLAEMCLESPVSKHPCRVARLALSATVMMYRI